jgi:hypothetical protein
MKSTDIIIAGIAGTTAFTLFSYMASKVLDKNKEEPELLGEMSGELLPGLEKTGEQFTGWMIHYVTGIAFAAAYKTLIKTTHINPTVRNGVIAGISSGLPAGLLWDTSLKIVPHPPVKRDPAYYIRLGLGHAIFGAVSFFVLGLFNRKEKTYEALEPIAEDSADSKLTTFATAGS